MAKIALIVVGSITAASASFAADPVKGGQLAQQWCSSCHVVGQTAPKTVQQGPPSFRMIAQSGETQDQLRTFLSHPHGAMPSLSLSRTEIADLIAYIETLR
ncbi:MAG TPA: c-type cytochrome [Stellaceae bacterium]